MSEPFVISKKVQDALDRMRKNHGITDESSEQARKAMELERTNYAAYRARMEEVRKQDQGLRMQMEKRHVCTDYVNNIWETVEVPMYMFEKGGDGNER